MISIEIEIVDDMEEWDVLVIEIEIVHDMAFG
jgi:hypothetical protein